MIADWSGYVRLTKRSTDNADSITLLDGRVATNESNIAAETTARMAADTATGRTNRRRGDRQNEMADTANWADGSMTQRGWHHRHQRGQHRDQRGQRSWPRKRPEMQADTMLGGRIDTNATGIMTNAGNIVMNEMAIGANADNISANDMTASLTTCRRYFDERKRISLPTPPLS